MTTLTVAANVLVLFGLLWFAPYTWGSLVLGGICVMGLISHAMEASDE